MKSNSKIRVHFLGAAGTVTGSKYLVDTGNYKVLIDCGMFQGLKQLRLLNWQYLPINVSEINTVLLTHGHMDHTGFLPRLVNMGYTGPIQGTAPTLDIASIILKDSAKIQEEEAERANQYGYSKHSPALPLYTVKDANKAIRLFKTVPDSEWIQLDEGVKARFQYNGHIVGATFIELEVRGKRLVFSGDIGRPEDLLLRPPQKPERADFLFVESTYGDRLHPIEDLEAKIGQIVLKTVEKGGTVLIPSFAVERTQTLMYLLWKLREKGAIPDLPMIMDSPMGANVLNVFHHHEAWHKLPTEDCTKMCKSFNIVRNYKDTLKIINDHKSKIVIAGSGMVTGGRILSYLRTYLEKPSTSILLVGYQAEGTRGRALLEGSPDLKIYGNRYPVRAEVYNIHALSAHADQSELLDWMSEIINTPEQIFIVHGEKHAADAFRVKVTETYGWNCKIPELFSIEEISG